MNKKKLSVVMAGAMLASSVAPVLAAEVTKEEVSADNLGLLISDVRELLNSKVFASDDSNTTLREKSVYAIYVNGKDTGLDVTSTQAQFQTALGKLKAGQTVSVYSKGYVEKDGKYYSTNVAVPTYTRTELNTLANGTFTNLGTGNYQNLISKVAVDVESGALTITFKGATGNGLTTLVLNPGDKKIVTNQYVKDDGTIGTISATNQVAARDFYGFVPAGATNVDIPNELVKTISITVGGDQFKVEDLYDGLMLTTTGHDLISEIKYYDTVAGNQNMVTVSEPKANGVNNFVFTITFKATGSLSAKTYTVTGTNKANINRLQDWLAARLAKVDILAGDNRYETAVTIAKEYAGLTDAVATAGTANIVLVNGNALVDGLAASPLAATKTNTIKGTEVSAPILLTEADSLPKATKAYLKEVIGNLKINGLDKATIHIVGGESVVSKSLERELRSLGFSVERYDGDNREETSLEVAEAINNQSNKGIFVVGAEGEADAMSIAGVASTKSIATKNEVTPIVVAKKGGISEDALYELKGLDVTVIGGENAVSKDDETALKEEAKSVLRISGSNRQATNAKIIEKYYKGAFATAKNVIVAKDGQSNKTELVDALAAANMASEKKAPIVLATNKLSDAQVNALELNANGAEALYQVGIGVNRDNVVKVIAQRLGLAN